MNPILLNLLVFSFTFNLFSQDTLVKYIDVYDNEVSTKIDAKYYFKIVQLGDSSWYGEKYNHEDTIMFSGTFKTKDLKFRKGYYIKYYPNGYKEYEGNFTEDKHNGNWVFYYQNGQVKKKGLLKDNVWTEMPECYDNYGNPTDLVFNYWEVNEKPEFPGGEQELIKFISKNFKYPDIALESVIAGRVFVSFIIDKNGKVKDVNIIRKLDPEIDKEAIRVVGNLPDWKPASINGEIVKVKYIIPISIHIH